MQRWRLITQFVSIHLIHTSLSLSIPSTDSKPCNSLPKFEIEELEANSFLSRHRRSNEGLFEEWGSEPNLERECVEERCSFEEANEYFQDSSKTDAFLRQKKKTCHSRNACDRKGTRICKQLWGKHECKCKKGFEGERCEKEVDYAKRWKFTQYFWFELFWFNCTMLFS